MLVSTYLTLILSVDDAPNHLELMTYVGKQKLNELSISGLSEIVFANLVA